MKSEQTSYKPVSTEMNTENKNNQNIPTPTDVSLKASNSDKKKEKGKGSRKDKTKYRQNNCVQKKFDIPEKHNEPGKTYFADPDPDYTPLYTDGLSMEKENEIIGDFLIAAHLPFEMVKPYLDLLKNEMYFKNNRLRSIREAVNQLLLTTYITAISNVLNSVDPRTYGDYKALKSITQTENLQLPNFLNAYLSMIGNIQSKLGKLEMRYARVYLESWATLAHEYFAQARELDNFDLDDLGQQIVFPVWNSFDGQDYIIQKYISWYNKCLGEFGVMSNGRFIMVSTPPMTLENFDAYVIQPEYQYTAERDRLVATLNQIRRWIRGEAVRDVEISGQHFSLRHGLDLRQLVRNLNMDVDKMKRSYVLFKDYFNTSDRIINKQGKVTQLISQADDPQAIISPVPISDGEAFVGYVTTPCEDYSINPKYRARFDRSKDNVVTSIVNKDMKAYASMTLAGDY